jgi:TPR repeat protein
MLTILVAAAILSDSGYHVSEIDLASMTKKAQKGDVAAALEVNDWLQKPLAEIEDAAELGHAASQLILGNRYSFGKGVSQSHAVALTWYLRAAEQGEPHAQSAAGYILIEGKGTVPKDIKAGVQWLKKAGHQGHIEAMSGLGSVHAEGIGVPSTPENHKKAVKWFRKAAVKNHGKSARELAFLLIAGKGVPKSLKKGLMWLEKAWTYGDAFGPALNYLGMMYATGEGVAKNNEKAVVWYKRAAALGDAEGQYNLGGMYHLGLGIPKDIELSVSWFRLAADQGHEKAKEHLNVLEWKLPAETPTGLLCVLVAASIGVLWWKIQGDGTAVVRRKKKSTSSKKKRK